MQVSGVPPYVLRIGNSLVAKYGFLFSGPNLPVAQNVRRCALDQAERRRCLVSQQASNPPHTVPRTCIAPTAKQDRVYKLGIIRRIRPLKFCQSLRITRETFLGMAHRVYVFQSRAF